MTENSLPKLKSTIANRTTLVLILLGVVSLVLYRICVRAEGTKDIIWFLTLVGSEIALYFGAVWLSLGRESRSLLIIALVFAGIFRLAILFSPPYLSSDIYRYVWDGRVQAAGINPYRYVPADPSLEPLRDAAIYPKINRRDYAHTIYPPLAEATYFLTTRVSESVTWMKVTILGFDAIALWAITQLLASFGLPRQRVLIYAWHPLVVWEFAGSGHVDALAIAFIVFALLARRKNADAAAGLALACAVLVKLLPLVLFPALYKRWGWKMPLVFVLVIIVAYLPYLRVGPGAALGFLPGYAKEQGLISGEQFYLLQLARKLFSAKLPNAAFGSFALLVMIGAGVWSVFKKEQNQIYLKRACALASITIVLFAPHYSWYFAWLVPFLCFVPLASLFYLTAASFVLYGTWLAGKPEQVFWLNTAIYLPCALLVAVELMRRMHFRLPGQLLEEASPQVADSIEC